MDKAWRYFQFILSAVGGGIGWFLGDADGVLLALVAFVVMDYITGVIAAAVNHELSSDVGFKGIARKVAIFIVVGIANVIDVQIIGKGAVLRTATVFFYISNEGLSIIENAGEIGIPIPSPLKKMLKQLRDQSEKDKSEEEGETENEIQQQ